MNRIYPLWTALIALTIVVAPLSAQQSPDEKRLTVHPAPLPVPALRYRFTVAPEDQVPGNAATAYLMAIAAAQADPRADELLETPLADLKKAGAQEFLDRQHHALENVEIATRRTDCAWESSFRQRGFDATLGYLNQCRWIANLLSIQARLRIAEGRYDDAARSIRDGFLLAQNLGREEPLVQSLVADGIEAVMLNDVRELVTSKDSPNLYWALANVRRPLIDVRSTIESETAAVFFTFPELKDHPERLSAEASRELLSRIASYSHGASMPGDVASGLFHLMQTYPRAKAWLASSGLTAQEIDALAPNSVALAYDVAQYRQQAQELSKWAGLPVWESMPGMRRSIERLQATRQEYNSLTRLLPTFEFTALRFARTDRELAMMLCVEGIRAYAAAHNGAPPPDLAALSPDTPAPLDPMLGKPFEYQVRDNAVAIRGAAPDGALKQFEMILHVTLER